MKIGLLFGSFNPIHAGHLIIANHIANFYTEEVWFVVSPQNPFKNQKDLLEVKQRLLLVKSSIDNDQRFKISDIEFTLPIPSYTINTLTALSQLYPIHEFQIIMGSDNIQNLREWKSADKILNTYKILVYERPGFPIYQNQVHPNVSIIQTELLNISATNIRMLIKDCKSIKYLVPEPAKKLIEQNGFYR